MVLFVVALLYVFVTPPFAVHDEANHFFKAYQLSLGVVFNRAEGGDLPAFVGALAREEFPPEAAGELPRYHVPDLVRAWNAPSVAEPRFTAFSNIANYSPTLYAAQALGILLARAAGLPPLGQFYAGRLLNALVGVSLVVAAIAVMPLGRPVLMAVASLPMAANQLGSLSADATIIGLSFLGLACGLRYLRPHAPGRWGIGWPVLLTVLALAKGVYVPLALAGLSCRGAAADARVRAWRRAWLAVSLGVAVVVTAAWMAANRGNFVRQAFVGRRSLRHMVAALPGEQLAYVAGHPMAFVHAVAGSFVERLPVYGIDAIGRFGWFTILLPLPLYGLAAAILVGAVIASTGGPPGRGERA